MINTEHFAQCIRTLECSMDFLRGSDPGSVEYEVYRNAVVKGFELSLETGGKLLRKTIRSYFGAPRAVDHLPFKDVFRHAAKHGLLGVEETERWFAYRANRNDTAHDYGAGFAEETLILLPDFLADAKRLREVLSDVQD